MINMIQRKTILVWISGVLVTVGLIAACGSGKYGEIEEILSDQAEITENYVNGLERAENAEDVAAVINNFTADMKKLVPKIKACHETNPEIWTGDGEFPKEVQVQQERLEAANEKVQTATMSLMTYMMDPKVQEAMMNMSIEMSKLQ
jgi:hypothetical protein